MLILQGQFYITLGLDGHRWLRERTPGDAILFTKASRQPIAVFAARALYVCADTLPPIRLGYSMTCLQELQVVKGYSRKEVSRRQSVLKAVLADYISPADANMLMQALTLFNRPIVIHIEGISGFRALLQERNIGKSIFETDGEVVWLIDRIELASVQRTTTGERWWWMRSKVPSHSHSVK